MKRILKDFCVVFGSLNARIIHASEVGNLTNVIHSPDLSKVHGFPPHHWKLVDGEILPLSDSEILERDLQIKRHGVDTDKPRSMLETAQQRQEEVEIKVEAKSHPEFMIYLKGLVVFFLGLTMGVILKCLMK